LTWRRDETAAGERETQGFEANDVEIEAMMLNPHLDVLRRIVIRLRGRPVDWVVTGSLGVAL
jgi:hypothetical protein